MLAEEFLKSPFTTSSFPNGFNESQQLIGVIVKLLDEVQPLLSVRVNVYVPAAKVAIVVIDDPFESTPGIDPG